MLFKHLFSDAKQIAEQNVMKLTNFASKKISGRKMIYNVISDTFGMFI